MRRSGYFTLEASFIFSFFIFLILGIINLDFYLHDSLLSDSLLFTSGLSYRQHKFFCSQKEDTVDVKAILACPVLLKDRKDLKKLEKELSENASKTFANRKIGQKTEYTSTSCTDIFTDKSNPEIIRAGSRSVKLLGGIANGN